ncbi:aminodeoxychorismate/anthranilate synthase component II [Bradyrhizobium sp. BRP14]|nr:aminodeoxychorismate/anthranilate synthase component II [Bradyrhizobium sp. BRP14]
MKTIVIDNKDSFTFNLVQYISEIAGEEPLVLENSVGWRELRKIPHDSVVLSPGPGSPHKPSDIGVCIDVIEQSEKPVLGVCLGHQCIIACNGGTVAKAPEAFHGRTSEIRVCPSALFNGLPEKFSVTRYHSLVSTNPLPENLKAIAWTGDGLVMAIEHRWKKQFGVQFHPESVASEFGKEITANFLRYAIPATSRTEL